MFVFANVLCYPIVIPYDVLDEMNHPKYISLIHNTEKRQLIIIPLKKRIDDAGIVRVPPKVYERKAAFAVSSHSGWRDLIGILSYIPQSFQNVRVPATITYCSDETFSRLSGTPVKSVITGMAVMIDFTQLDIMASEPIENIGETYAVQVGCVLNKPSV